MTVDKQGSGVHASHLQKSEVGVDAAVAQTGSTAAAGGKVSISAILIYFFATSSLYNMDLCFNVYLHSSYS